MTSPVIHAADLFCGAGGSSTAFVRACDELGLRRKLVAVNHWPLAIETHRENHPDVRHVCDTLEKVDPTQLVPGGRLNLLIASPPCTHHSRARGGRPRADQSRSSAWRIVDWASLLYIDSILIENVPEFESWGPLGVDGQPLKSRRGATYAAFIAALESLGYRVESRVLVAADYGDATTRRRLFIQAHRGRRPIRWPEPTHYAPDRPSLFGKPRPWRAAREVIDWSLPTRSIFRRAKPLRPKTLERIAQGLARFGGREMVPFVLSQQSGGAPRPVTDPLPTIATAGAIGLVEPFLVPHYGERPGQAPRTHSIQEPLPTIPASASKFGLVQPFLVQYHGKRVARSVDEPLPTVTTRDRFGLVSPQYRGRAIDIGYRMLQPLELARAMGFGDGYRFTGSASAQVRQIGNAWACGVGTALIREMLRRYAA